MLDRLLEPIKDIYRYSDAYDGLFTLFNAIWVVLVLQMDYPLLLEALVVYWMLFIYTVFGMYIMSEKEADKR